ncbi:17982_t:CDS:2, partial [Acaulospora morrowiae]
HANNCVKSRAIGIDKIISKLKGDPIIDKKDLGDFSTRSGDSAEDGFKDFETRNSTGPYASRRLPLSISHINDISEEDEEYDDLSM